MTSLVALPRQTRQDTETPWKERLYEGNNGFASADDLSIQRLLRCIEVDIQNLDVMILSAKVS